MDFTIKTYKTLLESLQDLDYNFQPFGEYLQNPASLTIILRHDVDKLPENSLIFAQIQYKLGIKGSYFFRIVPQSFDERIIKEIARLGHEIGYHYEDIDFAAQNLKIKDKRKKIKVEDLYDLAIESFQRNLEALWKIAPVKTICMHGSPMGRYDNRDLWKKYDYRDFGIIGEPYFDIDFAEVLYLTDTGRRWNGEKVSIWDKIRLTAKYAKSSQRSQSKESPQSTVDSQQYEDSKKIKSLNEKLGLEFKSTFDIIKAAEKGELPERIMMTFHPQRWTDGTLPWVKELLWQRTKNVIKKVIVLTQDKR